MTVQDIQDGLETIKALLEPHFENRHACRESQIVLDHAPLPLTIPQTEAMGVGKKGAERDDWAQPAKRHDRLLRGGFTYEHTDSG